MEGPDDQAAGVGGLVEQVVATDPGLVAIAGGKRLPEVHDAVLEVRGCQKAAMCVGLSECQCWFWQPGTACRSITL